MKLLSLKVEHFRCVRKVALEFGPGLNVLHGPNDLGKSSLAAAIRAVLLMQASSRDYEEFVNWSGTGVPYVELAFESEPQRIWRVRKTFGSAAQSYLDESRDGEDFRVECKGREVDGRLSEILQWGLAPPGGKGRPKGMPMTFLSTALLAEQDRVGAIFDQALSKDSDESGKKRLIQALQAVAEDPLYKSVLARVQAQFDKAYTSNGGKRRGKDSPWVQIGEEVRRKEEYERQCGGQVQKTAAIEVELQALHDRQLERRAAVDVAQGIVEQMAADHRAGDQRAEILGRLQESKARLSEIAGVLQALSQAEERRRGLVLQLEGLKERAEAAHALAVTAGQRAQSAKDEAARLQSADRARERLLKQTALEKQRAELEAGQVRNGAAIERIEVARLAAARVKSVEAEGLSLGKSLKDLEHRHNQAAQAVRAAGEQEDGLKAAAQLIRLRVAREALEKAEAGFAQINAWREEAIRKRAAAATIETALSALTLPSPALLSDLRQLDQQLQIARARLDVGLHLHIRPKRALRVTLRRDGGEPESQELKDSPLVSSASGEMRIDIDKVAEITLSGGAQTARDEVERLQKRWLSEAEPALERANAVTLDHLGRMVADAALRSQEIQEARRLAAQLEQRAADQPDWAALRAQRQQDVALAETAFGLADRPATETLARKLKIDGPADAEVRLDALRSERSKLVEAEGKLASELSAVNARSGEKQKDLAAAHDAFLKAQAVVEGGWEALLPRATERKGAIQAGLAAVQKELEALTTETGKALTAAKKTLDAAERERVAAEAEHAKAVEDLRTGEKRLATADGEIAMRREAASKLDEGGARAAVEQVEAELQLVSEPRQPVTAEMLAEARAMLQASVDDMRRIEDEIQSKRGALQHVGGEVVKQKADAAREALRAAREREHLLETEFAAWELLRTTLLDAEREEGVHLGRTLGDPIARRFAELTDRRYGAVALGPDLETHTITAAGDSRQISALSVGTRDQLSTIFRLSLAEQLQSALMLDDQLTQSDAQRMLWLRDLIRQLAENIQILVFTCRPADYLLPHEMKAGNKPEARKTLIRSINLHQAIERTEGTARPTPLAAGT